MNVKTKIDFVKRLTELKELINKVDKNDAVGKISQLSESATIDTLILNINTLDINLSPENMKLCNRLWKKYSKK